MKLFLTLIVGFFVVLLSVLLLLLQQVLSESRDATWRYWNNVADAAAVQAATATNTDVVVTAVRSRHGAVGAELELRRGGRARFGPSAGGEGLETITRDGPWGRLAIAFDATPLTGLRRTIFLTSTIVLTGALAAVVLVLLYIPRITRPIEQMLDHAGELERRDPGVDEQEFLIETFRKSVATLKAQQEELRLLHDVQKSRADDFERVTAALMRGLTSGLLAIGPDGRVVEVNDAAREMLRIAAPSDVVGRDLGEAIGDGQFAGTLREALAGRAPLTRIETTHRTGDGADLIIGVTTVPLLNEAGDLLGMLALFTDLTSIRSLEDRVRDLQALADLGEMSAGIAHEFRNSLSTILGYLKLVLRNELPAEATNRLKAAESEATQLTAAVERLLTFARPMTLQLERVDLRELTEDVVERLRGTASSVQITIAGQGSLDGDRALLARAVDNVVRNAVDAVAERGEAARISIEIADQPPAITVTDNGVGFDEADASRLLLPFVSNKPGGFGLGLSLARKVAVLHGGDIILNGTPQRGAVVTMSFAPTA